MLDGVDKRSHEEGSQCKRACSVSDGDWEIHTREKLEEGLGNREGDMRACAQGLAQGVADASNANGEGARCTIGAPIKRDRPDRNLCCP